MTPEIRLPGRLVGTTMDVNRSRFRGALYAGNSTMLREDFAQAMAFLSDFAYGAETAGHQPDIDIWCKTVARPL
jgi:hypothetical protein